MSIFSSLKELLGMLILELISKVILLYFLSWNMILNIISLISVHPKYVSFCIQLLSALYYLHSAEVVHRDIRSINILLEDSNCGTKLGGFKYARSLFAQPFNPIPVSPCTPPESIYMSESKPTSYLKAGDIWSLGCVFAEMLLGAPLFNARDKGSLLSKIFSITECKPSTEDLSRFPFLNSIQADKPTSLINILGSSPAAIPDALDLLKAMLTFDPGKRIVAIDALQHNYFNDAHYLDPSPRTCPLANELTDNDVMSFVIEYCGGV